VSGLSLQPFHGTYDVLYDLLLGEQYRAVRQLVPLNDTMIIALVNGPAGLRANNYETLES